jgi:predicted esterase
MGSASWPAATGERLIVAPEALSRYYTDHASKKVGATWMTSEDRLTEIADYVRYLDLVVQDVFASRGVHPDARVEVHGFSQGASTASRWVAFGEVRPARLVLWAGGMPPDLDLAAYQQQFTRAGVTVVIGDRDEFISEEAVAEQTSRLSAAAVPFDLRRFRGGHVIPWLVLEELAGMRGKT